MRTSSFLEQWGRFALATAFIASTVVPLWSTNLGGAQRAERQLTPNARLAEPFSRIRGVRELSNGQILIADQQEVGVFLVDFAQQTKVKIGREGAGPLEHGIPVGLGPYLGDSSLLHDLTNGRFAVLDANGDIAYSFANQQFGYFMGGVRADGDGGIYFDSRISNSGSAGRPVMRWRREANALDTLAVLQPMETFLVDGRNWPVPWSVGDSWDVADDGRVVIVRQDPYRIEWLDSQGNIEVSKVQQGLGVRVRGADRDAWNERPAISMAGVGGSRPVLPKSWPFPDDFPPTVFRGATVTSDGLVWVERKQSLEETRPLYDVFDRNASLVMRARLPAGRTVIGFGNGTVYATTEDADGLLWVERFATN